MMLRKRIKKRARPQDETALEDASLKRKRHKRNALIVLLFCIPILGYMLVSQRHDKEKYIGSLLQNNTYTTAILTKFNVVKNLRRRNNYIMEVSYIVNGKELKKKLRYVRPFSGQPQSYLYKRYMLIYDSTKVENAILLLEYPVVDSMTYRKCVELFRYNTPDITHTLN